MNLCILIGHLTKDPELRYTQSGKAVASFSIAIDRPYTNNGQKQADFFNVIAWGKLGENAAKYLSKGRQIAQDNHWKRAMFRFRFCKAGK